MLDEHLFYQNLLEKKGVKLKILVRVTSSIGPSKILFLHTLTGVLHYFNRWFYNQKNQESLIETSETDSNGYASNVGIDRSLLITTRDMRRHKVCCVASMVYIGIAVVR